jgi:signal transduction histidine kinase
MPTAPNRLEPTGEAPDHCAAPLPIASPPPPEPAIDRVRHQILLDTARQLASSLEPDAIFARMRESVCGAMRCDGLIVSSFDREENVIRCDHAWVGGNLIDPSTLPPLVFRPESGGMQTQVIRTGRPALFADVVQRVRDPRSTYYEVESSGRMRKLRESDPPQARSAIMTPLLLEGDVVGVLQVMADAENAYSPADLELLEGISLLLAVALENARLFRRAQDELEERRRTERALRETEDALREADRRKNEFLATLGHELRNPLSPIRTAVELLRPKVEHDPDGKWAHDVIQRQVGHLARLIDDLLDVGRITQGKVDLRLEVVPIDGILRSAVESIRPLLDGAGQRLTLRWSPEPVHVRADTVRLTQVFSNLLDNAAKYTPPEGRIELILERRDHEVVVSMRDTGIGIPAEHLPHVFDLFYQGERSGRRGQEGLGIGLTLVKKLVEMHGGTIAAFSEGAQRGSRFDVSLPIEAPVEALAPPALAVMASSRPRRVLIADENQDSTDAMALLLQGAGHQVQVAYDGESAFAAAETFRPDVMLLDIGMPRLSGHEVAERLRATPWGRNVVLIAATGWGKDEDRQRSQEAGFDVHLVKPVDPAKVAALIEQLAG